MAVRVRRAPHGAGWGNPSLTASLFDPPESDSSNAVAHLP